MPITVKRKQLKWFGLIAGMSRGRIMLRCMGCRVEKEKELTGSDLAFNSENKLDEIGLTWNEAKRFAKDIEEWKLRVEASFCSRS